MLRIRFAVMKAKQANRSRAKTPYRWPGRYNSRMFRASTLLSILLALPLAAAEPPAPPAAGISLNEAAVQADLVALAQVRDTDYFVRRNIPVSGSAYLKVLIAYKGAEPDEIIEVYEKGLHENECYFPDRTVFEEGRRYLLFLQLDPEDPERYRGLAEGCALEALVTADNRYALRAPLDGLRLTDPLQDSLEDMTFRDAYAVVDDEALTPADRDAMFEAGYIEPSGDGQWRFTQGIELGAVRRLIDPQSLED